MPRNLNRKLHVIQSVLHHKGSLSIPEEMGFPFDSLNATQTTIMTTPLTATFFPISIPLFHFNRTHPIFYLGYFFALFVLGKTALCHTCVGRPVLLMARLTHNSYFLH